MTSFSRVFTTVVVRPSVRQLTDHHLKRNGQSATRSHHHQANWVLTRSLPTWRERKSIDFTNQYHQRVLPYCLSYCNIPRIKLQFKFEQTRRSLHDCRTHARTHTSTRTHAYNKVAFTCTMSLDYFKFGHEIFAEWQTRGNHLQKENVSISIKIIRYCKRKTTFFFILENCIILMLKRKKLLPTDS